jgi:uncharacterized protein YaaR (DUF327 family)
VFMEKIDSLGEPFPRKSLKKSKAKKKQRIKYRSIFERMEAADKAVPLNADEGYPEPEYEQLEELLDEIYGLGDRLKSLPTLDNIKKTR